jgi:hypothetical protein
MECGMNFAMRARIAQPLVPFFDRITKRRERLESHANA